MDIETPGAAAAPATEADDFWSDAPPPEPGTQTEAPAPATRPPSATELLEGPSAQPVPPAAAQPPIAPASAPPAAAAPAAAPAAGAPPTLSTSADEWKFRADRDDINVEGSKVNPDGSLTIPSKHRETLEQLLAEGIAHRGSWREEQTQYETRIQELEGRLNDQQPEIARAKAFSDQLLALLDMGPDKVAEWLDNHQQNFPKFKADAENKVLQAQLADRDRRLSAVEEERLSQELGPQLQQTIAGAIDELGKAYPKVNAAAISQRITQRYMDDVAYEVGANERPRGLARGEVLIGRGAKGQLYIVNTGLIQDEFEYQAGLLQNSAAAAQAAVAGNAAIAQPGAGIAPALSSIPGVVPAQGEQAMPTFPSTPEGKKQMQEWLESGEWRKSVFPSTNT